MGTPTLPNTCMGTGANLSGAPATHFYSLAYGSGHLGTTTEAATKVPVGAATTWSNLGCRITTNGTTVTVHSRVNGADGNQTFSAVSTTGHFVDSTNTDSLAQADVHCAGFTHAGSNLSQCRVWDMKMVPSSGASQPMAWTPSGATACACRTPSQAYYAPVVGSSNANGADTIESNSSQPTMRAAGTFTRLTTIVESNGKSNASTLKLMKGPLGSSADQNNAISIGAGVTGALTDTTHSDTVTAGDKWKYHAVTASLPASNTNLDYNFWSVWFTSDTSAFDMGASYRQVNVASTSARNYIGLGGSSRPSTVETDSRIVVISDFTASRLRGIIAQNSATNSPTLQCYINSSGGSQSISLTNGTTGDFEDTTHTDSITAGQTLSISHDQPNNATWELVTVMLMATPPASGETATIDQTFTGISQAAEAHVPASGVITQTFSGMSEDLVSNEQAGFVTQTFSGISQAATAGSVGGDIAQTFSGFSQDAFSGSRTTGDVAMAFSGGLSQAAIAEASLDDAVLASQVARLAVAEIVPAARTTQVPRLVIAEITVPARSTQVVRLIAEEIAVEPRSTQVVRLVIGTALPCATKWQQLWRITRRDGLVFRFTSLDEDFLWGAETFKTCDSLNPSAAESASQLGQTGNIELEGIISSDSILEGDLYGGLFDDAFVEIWQVPWETDTGETPRRLAAGWTGNLSHGEKGFKMEVLGPGARIDQQALVQVVTPQCRWVFGSAQCTKDLEAMKMTGEVMTAFTREGFIADISQRSESDAGFQWADGRVRWTTGINAGQVCEVKEVDFDSGQVTLWALPAYLPEAGDEFDLLPGCDLSSTTCKDVYSNLINFGGFPDVPGNDAILATPDAKF